jgi:hypothetical protein
MHDDVPGQQDFPGREKPDRKIAENCDIFLPDLYVPGQLTHVLSIYHKGNEAIGVIQQGELRCLTTCRANPATEQHETDTKPTLTHCSMPAPSL